MPRLEGDIFIDEFYAGARAYFLSHFHSDHMQGLRKGWSERPIHCSAETASLLRAGPQISPDNICELNPGESVPVRSTSGHVRVTAFDANHCPGALMFLLEYAGHRTLYTGDFRYDGVVRDNVPLLKGVDVLYLDSTFEHRRYVFPPQEEAIATVLEHVRRNIDREILIALYTVGKNRVVSAINEAFGKTVYVSEDIFRAYEALGQAHLVTRDKESTNLRGYSRGYLERYFPRSRAGGRSGCVVIIPTGWAVDHKNPPKGFYYVPYSEHSSSDELREFVELVHPKRIINI